MGAGAGRVSMVEMPDAIDRDVGAKPKQWRREYTYLALIAGLIAVFAILFFLLDVQLEGLRDFGYAGIFLIALIGSASVILPLPGAAVVVGSSQFVDPVLGIPFWLVVGVVAALGETIGELTGYLAGVGGKAVMEDRPGYQRLDGWMQRHGSSTMFALSVIPNPFFDVAGFMAGAVRMPIWRFLVVVFIGKAIKNSMLALVGDFGLDALLSAFE